MSATNATPPRFYPGWGPIGITVTLILLSSASAHAQQAARPATPKKTVTQLTIRNPTKDTLRVEVRLGAASSCDANTTAAVQLISPGQRWIIASARPICWRRLNPNQSASAWTPWSRHMLATGQRLEVTL